MDMNFADAALLCFFIGWWLVSLVAQWKHERLTAIRSKDLLHLLPNWRFFAPVPARRDYHLEYRLRTVGSQLSRWTRIQILPRRTNRCVLWYPEKRQRKAFNTLIRR